MFDGGEEGEVGRNGAGGISLPYVARTRPDRRTGEDGVNMEVPGVCSLCHRESAEMRHVVTDDG